VNARPPLRAVLPVLGALLFFATLDATAKYLSQRYPVPLLVWARYLVHCLLMAILLAPRHGARLIATRRPLQQVVRALLLVACTGLGIAALARMPLAETTATFFVSPLLVALLAGPWLGERVGRTRWLAIATGFIGVLLIARPGGAMSADGLTLALASATCYASYQIMTRQLAATENTLSLLFYTALVGSIATSIAMPWYWQVPWPAGRDLFLTCILGVLGGCGHFLLIGAFRHAAASTLSPFLYAQLLWATLLGWLIFGQRPGGLTVGSMLLIAAAGLTLACARNDTQIPAVTPSPSSAGHS
jgi:drug/metabolite transporter (DMT)-like permease